MQVKNGHMRWSELTGQWVIYAPGRRDRPHPQRKDPATEDKPSPSDEKSCPFCPGHEDQLPEILYEMRGGNGSPWQTRVVPNKYPAVTCQVGVECVDDEPFRRMTAYGMHEVLIESPEHQVDLPDMAWEQIAHIWTTLITRMRIHLKNDATLQAFNFYHNHGHRAGASLSHPHAQLIATSVVPHAMRSRELIAQEYQQRHHRCLVCDLLRIEMEQADRLVCQIHHFTAFVPFAATVPYELWIVPRFHQEDFLQLTGVQKKMLSQLLITVLQALRNCLDHPAYNLILLLPSRGVAEAPYHHWSLQIHPRLTTPAGFEIASGMSINPSLPEADAQDLRLAL
jgi:UDPglucose--hexose-1-phosphate uridylyltransferase